MNRELPGQRKTGFLLLAGGRGFTLVEVAIVLLIASVVMAAVYNVYRSQQNAYTSQEAVAELQQNFRAAVNVMAREIRLAGHSNDYINRPTSTDCEVGPGVCLGSGNSQLVFTYYDEDAADNSVDYDGDGTPHGADPGELVKVRYDLYAAYDDGVAPADPLDDLARAVGSGNRQPTVLNIAGLQFRYLIDDGSGGFTFANSVDAANMRLVRGVEVTVLAKSGRPDRNYPETPSFTPPGGGVTWNLAKGERGRMFTTTVMCRNLNIL
ncbi:PilW family protein [Thiovibrio sp. JS02]